MYCVLNQPEKRRIALLHFMATASEPDFLSSFNFQQKELFSN